LNLKIVLQARWIIFFCLKMALFGWKNYEKYAWGENELRPISKAGHSAGIFGAQTKLGATIVDGLDTMYLMGFIDEYQRGRDWIIKKLNINLDAEYSAFEINIRFIGGLLSIYTLTEDKVI
jgi:mannosyl-oligosaccharide alpha-1,2-mannosidase